jgi:GT2 family glycosyltransferase
MDGGSSDNFHASLEKYAGIISYARSIADAGQSSAINEGSKKIKGKYFTWLNADDYYFPYTLKLVKNIFDRHPKVDIVYGDAIHVDPDGNFLSYFPPARNFNANELTYNCYICQPAAFVRSEAFHKVGGLNPRLFYTMDWDLWCRLSQQGYKFLYVNTPLAAVRYYPDTKTLSGSYKRLLELYRIEKKYGNRLLIRSWLGSYYYGLSFKDKNYFETLFYYAFRGLYETKQYFKNRAGTRDDDLLYGFHRWQPVVKNKCEIHFPWYHDKPWIKMRLRLKPYQNIHSYHISVNNREIKKISSHGYLLTLELNRHASNYSIITIENLIDENWELLSLRVN